MSGAAEAGHAEPMSSAGAAAVMAALTVAGFVQLIVGVRRALS